jgi:hypothetical protein
MRRLGDQDYCLPRLSIHKFAKRYMSVRLAAMLVTATLCCMSEPSAACILA